MRKRSSEDFWDVELEIVSPHPSRLPSGGWDSNPRVALALTLGYFIKPFQGKRARTFFWKTFTLMHMGFIPSRKMVRANPFTGGHKAYPYED